MKMLEQALLNFKQEFQNQLDQVKTEADLEKVRIIFLGRKGTLTELMTELKTLTTEEKRVVGPLLNEVKEWAARLFDSKQNTILTHAIALANNKERHFDVTAYRPGKLQGSLHPYTRMVQAVEHVFMSMGYSIATGHELETDYYNFKALNIPDDHPARDMHDTFWLTLPEWLARTHTSTVQVHTMEQQQPPIAIVAPGRVYRHEATDASHDFMFMQLEGLLIDKNISMSHLLATIQASFQGIFEKQLSIRVRPSYFPFVEPGVEIDITCPFCADGCSVCKRTKWIEAGGAGLVHPNVLKSSGINPMIYSGFAFGFGLTRLVMLKHGINDLRLLHNPKIEFLEQFS